MNNLHRVLAVSLAIAPLHFACGRLPAADPPPTIKLTHLEEIARAEGDLRSDLQIQRDNAFLVAIRDRDREKASIALKAGADPGARYIDGLAFLSPGQTGYTALLFATRNGDVEAVKSLLAQRVDVNIRRRGRSARYLAATTGQDEIVKLLAAAKAEGDPRQIRLTHELIRAACKGFEMGPGEGYPPYPGFISDAGRALSIAEVLEQGAEVNSADPEGFTPLMFAANLGLVKNVKTLLAHGADPNRKSERGHTAQSLAGGDASVNRAERKQIVQLLAERREQAGGTEPK